MVWSPVCMGQLKVIGTMHICCSWATFWVDCILYLGKKTVINFAQMEAVHNWWLPIKGEALDEDQQEFNENNVRL